MRPLLLAAALAVGPLVPHPAAAEDGPRILMIYHHIVGGDMFSWSEVYPDTATAEAQAEKLGTCGFWRADPGTGTTSLITPGAIIQVFVNDLASPPPAQYVEAWGGPVPPPPTADRIVNCTTRPRLAIKQLPSVASPGLVRQPSGEELHVSPVDLLPGAGRARPLFLSR